MLTSITKRSRQIVRLAEREGTRGVALRVTRRIERQLSAGGQKALWIHDEDIVDSLNMPVPVRSKHADGALHVGWISTPPAGGSGGHTTMFRLIAGLEQAGHRCTLFLYDVHDGDVDTHERRVRNHWPEVRADVRDVRDGLPVLDAWVATSWETAHVLAARPEGGGTRFYLVQDYEPYFYARGSEYALAEETYRFGFHGICAGRWLVDELQSRHKMHSVHFDFGADTDVYTLDESSTRDGVVFYAKPEVPRRAFALGLLALRRFAERYPRVPVHMFGEPAGRVPFDVQHHGRLTPRQLNQLYNRCRVGLSLSMTNVSLIPWELLACGVVPVVNDERHNQIVLNSEVVRWSGATPDALANAIAEAYDSYSTELARRASSSVAAANWEDAATIVRRHIEVTVRLAAAE